MGNIEGGCLCGAIRYSSNAEPVMTAVCHCKHCQRQTGSAFSPLVAVPKGTLDMDRILLTTFDDVGESGLPVKRNFCGKCGSPITTEVAAMPDLEWIKAGTLDDTSWVSPAVHIWCDSAQPWTTMSDSSAKFPKNPPSA
jgi:hypothetical protein